MIVIEDKISEEIKKKGLYEDGKIQKYETFIKGIEATNELIIDNSITNINAEREEIYVENCVLVKTKQDIAFDTSLF